LRRYGKTPRLAALRPMLPFEPMLASTAMPVAGANDYVLEPKWDGWRAIVEVHDRVRVWTRRGHELTDRLPELAPLAAAVDRQVVLDGELVAGQGRANDFYRVLGGVSARARRSTLTFIAFDVLLHGEPTIDQPYRTRRARLERLALNGPAWCTSPILDGGVRDALKVCAEHDVEGVVAKRLGSSYRPGERSPDWVKVKTASWRALHAERRHEPR
jgi:bifunctional non-homologous end joining protein LigD